MQYNRKIGSISTTSNEDNVEQICTCTDTQSRNGGKKKILISTFHRYLFNSEREWVLSIVSNMMMNDIECCISYCTIFIFFRYTNWWAFDTLWVQSKDPIKRKRDESYRKCKLETNPQCALYSQVEWIKVVDFSLVFVVIVVASPVHSWYLLIEFDMHVYFKYSNVHTYWGCWLSIAFRFHRILNAILRNIKISGLKRTAAMVLPISTVVLFFFSVVLFCANVCVLHESVSIESGKNVMLNSRLRI